MGSLGPEMALRSCLTLKHGGDRVAFRMHPLHASTGHWMWVVPTSMRDCDSDLGKVLGSVSAEIHPQPIPRSGETPHLSVGVGRACVQWTVYQNQDLRDILGC